MLLVCTLSCEKKIVLLKILNTQLLNPKPTTDQGCANKHAINLACISSIPKAPKPAIQIRSCSAGFFSSSGSSGQVLLNVLYEKRFLAKKKSFSSSKTARAPPPELPSPPKLAYD